MRLKLSCYENVFIVVQHATLYHEPFIIFHPGKKRYLKTSSTAVDIFGRQCFKRKPGGKNEPAPRIYLNHQNHKSEFKVWSDITFAHQDVKEA